IFQKEDDRPLRVGILHGLLKNWFIPKMIKLIKKSPRSVYIKIGTVQDLRRGIEEGRFDIIFSTENIQSELISSLKLFDEQLKLISKDEVNRKKLSEYRWIVYSSEDNLYKLSKKHSPSIIEVDDITILIDLVRSGMGVAVVPDHMLKKSDSLNVYDITSLPKSEIFMTTLNYKNSPGVIRDVSELVQNP
ncbi:MAG: LysR family transcriptional regulator substrate-binding protein, partial [Halobacteriovoraceae bacterium]|nr:LysR family transcriptional regulator substrate-binding protein [Halobacteriovoraceae bacterium]MBT5093247.1 LysR family transcriptional regulator substrate-binding protein [Halobacteriovoraceae bacterium]